MAHKATDIICKTTLEDHTADMLRFFYPQAERIFDFSKGFEWLNIELADLNPERKDMKDSRMADSLLKAHIISGEIVFIIIGIEFQAYHDPGFHERLFTYYYRLFDKYGKHITLLPIYTNFRASRSPSSFNNSLFNTELYFSVKPYKVWEQNEQVLMQSNNPYAFVILTIMLGRKGKQQHRFEKGIALVKGVFNKPFNDIDKVNLLKFIRLYFHFENRDLQAKFDATIDALTNKPATMGIIELDKKWAVEDALEEAEKEKKKAVKRALEEGNRIRQINDAKKMLQMGFDPEIIHTITELPLHEIKSLALRGDG